jgi:hypothetical protein
VQAIEPIIELAISTIAFRLGASMSNSKSAKQKILDMLHRQPDDIDYDRAIESIFVLRKIEVGIEQADRGEGTDHEDFMRELLGDDEEVQNHLDAAS